MFRSRNRFSCAVPVLLSSLLGLAASVPATAAVDLSGRLQANLLGVQLTNVGWNGYNILIGDAGLEYPRGSGKHVLFAGGLWLGAKVSGVPRIAVAEYSSDYAPGPMAGGTFQADRPAFRVYSVSRTDTAGAGDWMANAVPQGAPTSAFGTAPAHLGAQTTFAVYNDADAARHVNNASMGPPLGVEVRQTSWASADNVVEDHAMFIRYQVVNRGAATLDSMFLVLWADPDLGGGTDDLVASDPAQDMAYVYNATNSDVVYGSNPPALAYVLMQGPRSTPASNPMHAFAINNYIGGSDPANAVATYRMLLGLKGDASPWIDPGTGQPSRFVFTGDPVAGTGWLQPNQTDQRFLISCGPLTMAPGDSQEVVMAIVVAQGANRLQSISLLRSYVASLRALVDVPPSPDVPLPGLALAPPANPSLGPVRTRLTARAGATWQVDVFDAAGRRVARVARGTGTGQPELVAWDPRAGSAAPGVYWIVASAGGERASRRVVVLAR